MRIVAFILLCLSGCQTNGAGIQLAPGWSYQSLSAWKEITPNKLAISASKKWLYMCGQRSEFSSQAGLIAIRLKNSRTHVLLQGMRNCNGLNFGPDGSLWLAEDDPKGVIWRMADPDIFPDDQRVDPLNLSSSHKALAPFHAAGHFNQRAIAFSKDGRFAYLADASAKGSLYRLNISSRSLAVFHKQRGWLAVGHDEAAEQAVKLGAESFAAIQDIALLPDGKLLLAESGRGRILQLDDHGSVPYLKIWMENPLLTHPSDLSWDHERHWLWITDYGEGGVVWAWDGTKLHEIARHGKSHFAGVLAVHGTVYLNIQRGTNNPSMTIRLQEKSTKN
ncbi:MAG: hypothetical protein Q9M31_07210 [Mariprofundus sp.]|nr:hypothetical protein [Mariprofundus sp.]